MVVNKKNIKQSLFELGIQLFLGTRSVFTALCHCFIDSELVTILYRRKVTYILYRCRFTYLLYRCRITYLLYRRIVTYLDPAHRQV